MKIIKKIDWKFILAIVILSIVLVAWTSFALRMSILHSSLLIASIGITIWAVYVVKDRIDNF